MNYCRSESINNTDPKFTNFTSVNVFSPQNWLS